MTMFALNNFLSLTASTKTAVVEVSLQQGANCQTRNAAVKNDSKNGTNDDNYGTTTTYDDDDHSLSSSDDSDMNDFKSCHTVSSSSSISVSSMSSVSSSVTSSSTATRLYDCNYDSEISSSLSKPSIISSTSLSSTTTTTMAPSLESSSLSACSMSSSSSSSLQEHDSFDFVQEVLHAMCRQERTIYSVLPSLASLPQHQHRYHLCQQDVHRPLSIRSTDTTVTKDCRYQMIEWCYKVVQFIEQYTDETVEVAINIIDRYWYQYQLEQCDEQKQQHTKKVTPATAKTTLSRSFATISEKELYQLVCITSLYIAVKVHEVVQALTIQDFLILCKNRYTKQQIQDMEYTILSTLKWYIHPPTTESYIRNYIHLVQLHLQRQEDSQQQQISQEEETENNSKPLVQALSQEDEQRLHQMATQYCNRILLQSPNVEFHFEGREHDRSNSTSSTTMKDNSAEKQCKSNKDNGNKYYYSFQVPASIVAYCALRDAATRLLNQNVSDNQQTTTTTTTNARSRSTFQSTLEQIIFNPILHFEQQQKQVVIKSKKHCVQTKTQKLGEESTTTIKTIVATNESHHLLMSQHHSTSHNEQSPSPNYYVTSRKPLVMIL